MVFSKVKPRRQILRFGKKKGKLSPRYVRPFEILQIVGVTYRIALPL